MMIMIYYKAKQWETRAYGLSPPDYSYFVYGVVHQNLPPALNRAYQIPGAPR